MELSVATAVENGDKINKPAFGAEKQYLKEKIIDVDPMDLNAQTSTRL